MHKYEAPPSAAAYQGAARRVSLDSGNLLDTLDSLLCPLALIASLAGLALFHGEDLGSSYLGLFLLVFLLTFPGHLRLQSAPLQLVTDVLLNWLWIVALLWLAGTASGYIDEFPRSVLLNWLWAAPATEITATGLMRLAAPAVLRLQGPPQRAILVGMNEQAVAFGHKLKASPLSRIDLLGFVDSRSAQRLEHPDMRQLGTLEELATLVQSERVQLIYMSLPMSSQPRILQVLDALKDTTASIYFVPDMFVTDLIQGHAAEVCDTAVIAVCETPFTGLDGFVKRASDMVFALLISSIAMAWTGRRSWSTSSAP